MAIHPDYLRCLGLVEALKFLHRLGRLDDHFHGLLLSFEVKLKQLDGVELKASEVQRLDRCQKTIQVCWAAWDAKAL